MVALMISAASAQEIVAEPEGYRSEEYRAPTPPSLKGARIVTTAEAEAIWREKRGAFIDVMPRPPKPANLPPGTVWRDKPRSNIPGSIWLPDTGYGQLAAETDAYLRDGLSSASAGRTDALLVIYCQADCWMSWNAAKRAMSYGYTNVVWFPEGTDGWEKAALPLIDAEPVPRKIPTSK